MCLWGYLIFFSKEMQHQDIAVKTHNIRIILFNVLLKNLSKDIYMQANKPNFIKLWEKKDEI